MDGRGEIEMGTTGTVMRVAENSLLLEGHDAQGAYYRLVVLPEVQDGELPLVLVIDGVRYALAEAS